MIQFPLYIIIAYDIIKKSGKEDSNTKQQHTNSDWTKSLDQVQVSIRSCYICNKDFPYNFEDKTCPWNLLVARAAVEASVIISRRISAGRSIWGLLEKFTDTVIYGKITLYFKGCSMFRSLNDYPLKISLQKKIGWF